MEALRERLTYANVMATVAVFLALGGVSYAAVSLPRGSVGREQLRKDSVTKSKIARKSVGRSELRRRGVTKGSLSPWIRRQLRRRAKTGATGPRGATGARGLAGPPARRVRYSAAASATPEPVTAFDLNALRLTTSCDQSGATTTLNFSVRSADGGTLEETITVDGSSDPNSDPNAPGSASTANLRINLPAGTPPSTGGPSAGTGYTRVNVDGIYVSASTTMEIRLVAFVDGDADRCSLHGIVVPA
jgi:hypothetical protein